MTDESSSNKASGQSNAIAMARERFQSSAREFIKNVESVVMASSSSASLPPSTENDEEENKEGKSESLSFKEGAASIEQAIRVMFSSCTTGAEQFIAPTSSDESAAAKPDRKHLKRSSSTPSNTSFWQQKPKETAAPTGPKVTPRSSPVATTTMSPSSSRPTKPHSTVRKVPQQSSSQRDLGEHIYAQLFHDDCRRDDSIPKPTMTRRQRSEPIPKPFPVSSPPHSTAVPSQELHLPAEGSFDDSISAISALTLEAMAQVPTSSSSSPSRITVSKDCVTTSLSPAMSRIGRSRSHGSGRHSLPSKGSSKNSKMTRTTTTTESSGRSFEVWKEQETEFWNGIVVQETEEAVSPWRRHRHDAIRKDRRLRAESDPDRLKDVLHTGTYDDSEMAEI